MEGRFCAQCGQRAIPAYPSVREFIGDAWQELSGYDGRFARTIRTLFRTPGALTREVLEGKRARYVSPLRLYLVASLIYFVLAASAPNLRIQDPETSEPRELKIGLWAPGDDFVRMSPEDRAQIEREIGEAHWLIRPFLESLVVDPAGVNRRILEAMPKMFFALVPMFAGIVALFYWGRPYLQHLTFALHLHAVTFFTLAFAQLPKFTGNLPLAITVAAVALLFIAQYALRAFRRMYGNGWALTAIKAASITVVYVLAFVPALIVVLAWAAWSR